MDYYEFIVFQQVITKLDNFYVTWVYEQMKKEAPNA